MARIVLGPTMNQNDLLLAAVTPAQGNTALGPQPLFQATVALQSQVTLPITCLSALAWILLCDSLSF